MLNPAVGRGDFRPVSSGFRLHGWLLAIWFASVAALALAAALMRLLMGAVGLG